MAYNLNYYSDEDSLAISGLTGGSKLYKEAQIARINFASKFIKQGDIVADVCSGPPFASQLLNCKKYFGVDHPDLISSVREMRVYPPNVEMVPFDFENAKAEIVLKEKANVVISFETIEHTPNPDVFLKKIFNILKPEGLLVLSTPNNPYNEEPMSVEHFIEYSVNDMTKMLEKAGFEIVERKVMGIPLRWIMRQAKKINVQTNRFNPENEERGRLSKMSDKIKLIRNFCNGIFPYSILGLNWGNLGLNMVLVAKKVK